MSNDFITAPENNKGRFKIAKTKLIRKHGYMSFRGKDYNKRLKFAEILTDFFLPLSDSWLLLIPN